MDIRKSELAELRHLLQVASQGHDIYRRREALRQVIGQMTAGVNLASLFREVLGLARTSDVVQKKLIYLYLVTYACSYPDVYLIAVDTVQRDCKDEDPAIRGASLRSWANIDLRLSAGQLEQTIQTSLGDASAYVRTAACMATVRLVQHRATLDAGDEARPLKIESLGAKIVELLRDADAYVAASALQATRLLQDHLPPLEMHVVKQLLNRITEFSPFGCIAVLQVVGRNYFDAEAIYDVANTLDPLLSQSDPEVVVHTIRCFLIISENHTDFQVQVAERVTRPLLTILEAFGTLDFQLPLFSFAVRLLDLARRSNPSVYRALRNGLGGDAHALFIKANDPTAVRLAKLRIVEHLITDTNFANVQTQLTGAFFDQEALVAAVAAETLANAIHAQTHLMTMDPDLIVEAVLVAEHATQPTARAAAVHFLASVSHLMTQSQQSAIALAICAFCRNIQGDFHLVAVLKLLRAVVVPDTPMLLYVVGKALLLETVEDLTRCCFLDVLFMYFGQSPGEYYYVVKTIASELWKSSPAARRCILYHSNFLSHHGAFRWQPMRYIRAKGPNLGFSELDSFYYSYCQEPEKWDFVPLEDWTPLPCVALPCVALPCVAMATLRNCTPTALDPKEYQRLWSQGESTTTMHDELISSIETRLGDLNELLEEAERELAKEHIDIVASGIVESDEAQPAAEAAVTDALNTSDNCRRFILDSPIDDAAFESVAEQSSTKSQPMPVARAFLYGQTVQGILSFNLNELPLGISFWLELIYFTISSCKFWFSQRTKSSSSSLSIA